MEICDRCFSVGDFKPSVKKISINITGDTFGFCESCFVEFGIFMENKKNKKKSGRPPKKK